MKTYFFNNQSDVSLTMSQDERVELFKKMAKSFREQLYQEATALFPKEIEYFITIFEAELKFIKED